MRSSRPFVRVLVGLLLLGTAAMADEGEKPAAQYRQDFQKLKTGEPPEEFFVLEGEFKVVGVEKNKVLQLETAPLVEGGVLFGKSEKGSATVQVRIKSLRKRRSYPRFAVGLHGISGYRLRVAPAGKRVELVKDEEVVHSVPFSWKADAWCTLRLEVKPVGSDWLVQGWVWPEGEDKPEKPIIQLTAPDSPGQGKASLWGTPYSGKVIQFDDLEATGSAAPTGD